VGKGRDRLHEPAELDGAGEIARRGHEKGENDGRLGIPGREPGQTLLAAHDAPPVGHHLAETSGEAPGFLFLAAIEADGLGVFPHPHQIETEIRLVALLEEVEADQRSADDMGEH